jgi:hypothetical protein
MCQGLHQRIEALRLVDLATSGSPFAFVRRWILVEKPSRERPIDARVTPCE